MKKTCFLLQTCNIAHSHGLIHGVYADEVEAVADMWRLASVYSRGKNLPVSDHSRRWVTVGDVCFRLSEVKFFG